MFIKANQLRVSERHIVCNYVTIIKVFGKGGLHVISEVPWMRHKNKSSTVIVNED